MIPGHVKLCTLVFARGHDGTPPQLYNVLQGKCRANVGQPRKTCTGAESNEDIGDDGGTYRPYTYLYDDPRGATTIWFLVHPSSVG